MDRMQMRCPRLGGEVTFGYCRKEGGEIPCPRTIACWSPYFPVEEFLRQELTSEQWMRSFGGEPKAKILSIIELVEEAKKKGGIT